MRHQIVDINCNDINACFQFVHGDHVVSCSTIMKKGRVEVVYWNMKTPVDVIRVSCVQAAIYEIDEINKNEN
jgi:hypothetical protein